MKKENRGMYNVRLAKLIGVHQTLAGSMAYHVAVRLLAAYLIAIAAVMVANAVYYASQRPTEAALYFGSAVLLVYQCYKVCAVLGHWTDVRDCMRIARHDFAAGRARSVVPCPRPHFDRRVVRATDAYAVAGVLFALMYAASPLPFLGSYNAMPAADGSVGLYRPAVLNLYAGVPANAYNAHYAVIYAAEVLASWVFMFFVVFYDTILITLCVALTRRLRDVATAFRSAGRAADLSDCTVATTDHGIHSGTSRSRNQVIYDDLKSIISYHQAVMMILEKFFSVYRPLILSQIFISSINIILIWYTILAKYFDAKSHKMGEGTGSTLARMVCSCPFMSFQLVLTCYLFESLHRYKESIIFALYESNWTDMNIKCRNLLLFTMRLVNAHKRKLKFSQLRVVNMEMFFTTIRVCYSVLSMLMHVKTRSIQ